MTEEELELDKDQLRLFDDEEVPQKTQKTVENSESKKNLQIDRAKTL